MKANFFYKKSNIPVISDDSGIEISAFKGKPGINSARWAKKQGGFKKAMNKILINLKNKKNRNAIFVCCLALKIDKKRALIVEGRKIGTIAKKIVGKNGFGYDPIFILNKKKKTFGEMKPSQKYRIDHRYKAFKKIKKLF